jgi:hypothetical protein
MAQNGNGLPEGTDTIINGAAQTTDSTIPADTGTDALIDGSSDPVTGGTYSGTPSADAAVSSGGGSGDWRQSLRSGSERLTGEASGKARDFLGQGLERSAEGLANLSRMVGDTAVGIEERLGQEYGDYARRAAEAIENAANSLASKNPEDLIEDSRNFVRKSPGVALAGAAVIGFALTRLIKNGLTPDGDEAQDSPPRTTSAD